MLSRPVGKSTILVLCVNFLLIILISTNNDVNGFGLVIGSGLLISTILLSALEGYRGLVIAVLINLIGCCVSLYFHYENQNQAHILVAFLQFGNAIACVIIGIMSHNQRVMFEKLEKIAFIDYTTESFTHRYFHEMYAKNIAMKDEFNNEGLIIIDIDNFNQINKHYGYNFGDQVLKHLVDSTKPLCSSGMHLCRLGGDVFVLYCSNTNYEKILEIIKKLKDKLKHQKIEIKESADDFSYNVSFGVAHYPETSNKLEDLLQDGFSALNYAKNSGKDNIKIFRNLFNDLQLSAMDNDQIELSLKIMLGMISQKDEYTQGHSIRVADYVFIFGKCLNIPEKILGKLKIAALIHDVGKVNVPIDILKKPGKLSENEFEAIKKHVNLGNELVNKLPIMQEFGDIVLHHHERYDGNGYPDGLIGEEIPFYSRLISIVDSYDAMLSIRPYRLPLSKEEIIKEFRKNSGIQFDPTLTEIFIDLIEKNDFENN